MAEPERFDDYLLHEILSRVPAKALGRFKIVSRRWQSLISDPYFLATQARRSMQKTLGILNITVNPQGGRFMYFALNGVASEAPDIHLGLPRPCCHRISIKAACNGLIFYELFDPMRFMVGNPTTKTFRQLPYLAITTLDTQFGLAFNPVVSGTSYQIVACMRWVQVSLYKFIIFSPEVGAWRTSEVTLPCTSSWPLFKSVSSAFFNGALHWLRERGGIVVFKMDEEKAYVMALPQGMEPLLVGSYSNVWFGVAMSCMTLIKFVKGDILVWVLVDYGRNSWCFKHRIRTEGSGAYYRRTVPIFFDGEASMFLTWGRRHEFWLSVYRIGTRRWDNIRRLHGWMDCCRHFFPYISHMLGSYKISPASRIWKSE